ncbi:MAG TPA: L,D-transpeptidase family protein [Allosphingosinicella sp.]
MPSKPRLALLPLLLAAAAAPAFAQLQTGEQATAEQVAAGEVPAAAVDEREKVHRSIQDPALTPQWTPRAAAELLEYIRQVGEEGLDPVDYQPEILRAALDGRDPAALSTAATNSFLRLSADLALGHVSEEGRVAWHLPDSELDSTEQYSMMQRAIRNDSVRDMLSSLLPTHPQYAELKGVLATTTDPAVRDKARVNLERWRWLPRDLGQRYVIVNVPAYTVALVEDGQVVTRHRAVVGAPKTATPQLAALATGVIFNPWWEVPASITPEVRGKRGYKAVKTEQGGVRYRQPPGASNALGRMKVVMPNSYAIYLHDTPAKALFKKPARAFSHGCIRTENALDFAQILLGNPEWDHARIRQTIAEGKTVKADAVIPTPVYITYFTAAASKDNGGIIAYNDIYGRDATVATALNEGDGKTALASTGN